MENLPITILDIAVVGIVLLSALVGLAIGFIRGGLFLLSWVGAIIATVYGFSEVRPFARRFIESDLGADFAAGIGLFITALVLLFIVSTIISGWVRSSRLNALDRSLGMIAGVVAAVSVISGLYLPFQSLWPPPEQPSWVREAKLKPWIEYGAGLIQRLVPGEARREAAAAAEKAEQMMRKDVETEVERALEELTNPPPKAGAPAEPSGYNIKERREMERLIENAQ